MTGDERFYEVYVAPLEARMIRTIWRVVRDPETARDVFQEVLVRVWRRREQVRNHPNPHALLLRICIHSSCDALRREQRHRRLEDPRLRLHFLPQPVPERPPTREAHDLEAEVRHAVSQLPRNQAAALLMRLLHAESYETIARALGCSQVTARIHVMRARARLRRALSGLIARRQPAGERV